MCPDFPPSSHLNEVFKEKLDFQMNTVHVFLDHVCSFFPGLAVSFCPDGFMMANIVYQLCGGIC